MIELSDSDLRPIEECPLIWRWAAEGNTPLSQDTMVGLRCILPQRASTIHDNVLKFYHNDGSLVKSHFKLVRQYRAKAPDVVHMRLRSLSINMNQEIILSWHKDTAVICQWFTFVDHWRAFCYPGSDDISIIPTSEEWLLTYYHFELFEYAEFNAV